MDRVWLHLPHLEHDEQRPRLNRVASSVAKANKDPRCPGRDIVTAKSSTLEGATDVRFGSKADMCAAKSDVRFASNSDRESGFSQNVMSALTPKADIAIHRARLSN